MSLSHPQHSSDGSESALREELANIGQEIVSLDGIIKREQQAWLNHVEASRSMGPHRLPGGTHIRTPIEITHQLEALSHQLNAYNTRIRGVNARFAALSELEMGDLVSPEDTAPRSTETATSIMRRVIIAGRLELMIFTATLRKGEDWISTAFQVLGRTADHIRNDFHALSDAPDTCLWCLQDEHQTKVLMLKAAMARLGMHLPRQRLIDEYYSSVGSDEAVGGNTGGQDGGVPGTDPEADLTRAVEDDGCETREVMDADAADALDRYCEADSDMGEASEIEDDCVPAEHKQTCITDYYSPSTES